MPGFTGDWRLAHLAACASKDEASPGPTTDYGTMESFISENHPYFSSHQKHIHFFIIVASRLIEYCHTGNFGFPVLILKYFNFKKYLANFDKNCKIDSKENNGMFNSDKFSRGYDNLHLGITI